MNKYLVGIGMVIMLVWMTEVFGRQEQGPPAGDAKEPVANLDVQTLAELLKKKVDDGRITNDLAFELMAQAAIDADRARVSDWWSGGKLLTIPATIPRSGLGTDQVHLDSYVTAVSALMQTTTLLNQKVALLEQKLALLQQRIDECCTEGPATKGGTP